VTRVSGSIARRGYLANAHDNVACAAAAMAAAHHGINRGGAASQVTTPNASKAGGTAALARINRRQSPDGSGREGPACASS